MFIRKAANKGFTLVEVAIGSVILLLIILPAIAVISNSMRVVDKARDVTLASSMMQTIMEEIRMQTYTNACTKDMGTPTPALNATSTYSHAQWLSDLNLEGFNTAQAKQFQIVGTFTAQATGQVLVELTASWKDMNQQAQSHRLATIISEGGLSDNVNKGW
jgi:Tfp pilus assembly protein PilV